MSGNASDCHPFLVPLLRAYSEYQELCYQWGEVEHCLEDATRQSTKEHGAQRGADPHLGSLSLLCSVL